MKKFRGKILTGKVVSVHMGNNEDLSKDTQGLLTAEIGFLPATSITASRGKPGKWIGNSRVRYAAMSANGPVFR
jgi:hypothetical protein